MGHKHRAKKKKSNMAGPALPEKKKSNMAGPALPEKKKSSTGGTVLPEKTRHKSEHHHHRHRKSNKISNNNDNNIPVQTVKEDDVAVVVADTIDQTKLLLHIQLQYARNASIASFFRAIWESTVSSFKEVAKKKYTFLYVFSLVAAIIFTGHISWLVKSYGIPPTSDTTESVTRFIASLVLTLILSPMAFYILNLKINNLGLGVIWMFLIVSLQYFIAIALSKAAYFLYHYNDRTLDSGNLEHVVAFRSVFSFVEIYYENAPPSGIQKTSYKEVYLLEKITKTKILCDRDDVLDVVWEVASFVLAYSIFMEVACVGMAIVFWYYYSDQQAQVLASAEVLADFELLHLNRPHLEGQIIELTEKEKLRRQKRRRRMSRMRQLQHQANNPASAEPLMESNYSQPPYPQTQPQYDVTQQPSQQYNQDYGYANAGYGYTAYAPQQ